MIIVKTGEDFMIIFGNNERKKMSVYKLSKTSTIPYATCNDIVNGKVRLEKRSSFENFKSNICHRVKEMGDINFIIDTLENQEIFIYFKRKWYPESLYLLAMLDYISRENEVPLCAEYDDIRQCRLKNPIYPASILALSAASGNDDELKRAAMTAIPEFKRFNIIENDVRNVI